MRAGGEDHLQGSVRHLGHASGKSFQKKRVKLSSSEWPVTQYLEVEKTSAEWLRGDGVSASLL